MAGEWYLDKKAGVVSYWPMAEDLTRDEAVAPVLRRLVAIDGANNVTFRGLDFRHADWLEHLDHKVMPILKPRLKRHRPSKPSPRIA